MEVFKIMVQRFKFGIIHIVHVQGNRLMGDIISFPFFLQWLGK